MNTFVKFSGAIALALGMSLSNLVTAVESSSKPEPEIAIGFESDSLSGDEFINAETGFHARRAALWNVFAAITEYPELHAWIREVKLIGYTDNNTQEFLIEFEFPWPVGSQWSRIEVIGEHGSKISWRQIDGSLDANEGCISFATQADQAHIHYRAIIDVGVPAIFTRPYKKKFVSEFLIAINDRVTEEPQGTRTMTLATN